MDKIIIAAGLLLIVYAFWQTVQKFRGKAKNSCCGTAETVFVKKVDDTDLSHYPYRYILQIDHMKCSNCARTVENMLNNMPGVWAIVDLGKNKADVLAKQIISESEFEKALRGSDYTLKSCTLISDIGK